MNDPRALLVLASLLLFAGHVFRSARWAILFPPAYITRRFNLLLGLSIGYVVNAIVPWRIGEIVRAAFVSRREATHFAFVAATVVAERLSDLLVVAALTFLLAIRFGVEPLYLGALALAAAAAIVAVAFAVRRSRGVRQAIWRVASIFNTRIRFAIADFFWTLGELIVGGVVLRPRYIVMSAIMWAVYGLSYWLFARATGAPVAEILFLMLGTPLRPVAAVFGANDMLAVVLLIYAGLPLIVVLVYAAFKQWSAIVRAFIHQRRYGLLVGQPSIAGTRDRFKSEQEYEYFLVSLFSGEETIVTTFGLRAVEDGVIHRLFQGGSDAVTALVEVNDTLLIRKFAVGNAKDKLSVQREWLDDHRSEELPLVRTLGSRATDNFFRYDMPLVVPASDFYDVIHTAPVDRSRTILTEVLDSIDRFHRETRRADAADALVQDYIAKKAVANTRVMLDFARTVLPEQYTINGEAHRLADLELLADPAWLGARMPTRATAVVHGDLTIENIIVAPGEPRGWYIIDPNPENLFDSPLIDWAKMMQSLHLGYEALNRSASCTITDGVVHLALSRSQVYSILHRHLEELIADRLGADRLQEVYLHELIHYLRLTPYKIRQNARKGMVFFACTAVLLKQYRERFG